MGKSGRQKLESKGASLKIANILISDVWGDVSPEALNRGIGGREGAMIYLSREWVKMGHQVTNFVNVQESSRFTPPISQQEFPAEGYHEYVPLNITKQMLAFFPWDVAIAWECPTTFADHRILNNVKLKICEMQVCHFSTQEMEAAGEFCDYVAALSPWHKGFLLQQGLEMEEDEVVIFPNGVDINKYPVSKIGHYGFRFDNDPTFVYSSSPDRGLWPLLRIWEKIRSDFERAELIVTYGAQKWINQIKWSHGRQGEMAVEMEHLMQQPGITDLGKIGQDKLAELQQKADIWAYPLDAMSATESGCITAVENAAAGNPIVTTDCDCMPTEFGRIGRIVEMPFDEDNFYGAVKDVLTDEAYYSSLQRKGRSFAETRDWSKIATQWTDLFKQHV